MKFFVQALIVFTYSTSFASATTLLCQDRYIQVKATVNGDGSYSGTRAVSADGENLHATDFVLEKSGQSVSGYGMQLQALDENCSIHLPNNLSTLSHFVAHLICENPNGRIVNDDPTEGMAGLLHGEQLDCQIAR